MIRFEQVTKRYLSKTALIDVDLEFPAGKIIGVVGENGSGKSTMLKLIAGLLRPTKGRVLVNGEPSHRRIARKVAYLSELETYYPFFTVQETVDYHAAQFGDLDRKKPGKSSSSWVWIRMRRLNIFPRETGDASNWW